MGCSSVVIKTDSLELVHVFNGQIDIWSPYAAILADCFQLASRIDKVHNNVTHKLAAFCFNSNFSICWDRDPLSFILPNVTNDDPCLS
jgi:hypothetical protein